MPELIPRIYEDMFSFIEADPEDASGLLEFWYDANTPALSAAMTAKPGVNLMLNVSSFSSFEQLSKKLFLVADTLVLRDTRKFTEDEQEYRVIPVPPEGYKPGYIDDILDQLKNLQPSPLTLMRARDLYWTSETKTLKNGLKVAYAAALGGYHSIPTEFFGWITGTGKDFMRTGRVVYAPFIPTPEMEMEFFKSGVNLPDYFNAMPCWHQNESFDWLDDQHRDALLSLKFPFLEGIGIETITKVKEDYGEEFLAFSRTIRHSVTQISDSIGTAQFAREVKNIQTNQIDAAVDEIDRTVRKIKAHTSLRKAAVLMGALGLAVTHSHDATIAAGLVGAGGVATAMVLEKIEHMKQCNELRAKAPYFLWQLKNQAIKSGWSLK